jgi:hypothetical protein
MTRVKARVITLEPEGNRLARILENDLEYIKNNSIQLENEIIAESKTVFLHLFNNEHIDAIKLLFNLESFKTYAQQNHFDKYNEIMIKIRKDKISNF